MERLCEKRTQDGFPGKCQTFKLVYLHYCYLQRIRSTSICLQIPDGFLGKSIQWGFIGDVGIVQDSLGGNKLYHLGMVPQRVESFLETIDVLLQMPDPVGVQCGAS